MVPLDRALLSSYRLPIVTIPLSVTVWQQICNANFEWRFHTPKLGKVKSCGVADGTFDRALLSSHIVPIVTIPLRAGPYSEGGYGG